MSASDTYPQTERLHGLDALRGGALLLGVALHATMSFIPAPIWVVQDTQPSQALTLGFYAVHVFRMAVFFLIAGFFARLALHRRGTGGFVLDRLKRVAGPLFVFWPLVMTGIVAVLIWIGALMTAKTGVAPPAPPPPAFTPTSFPLTHLWFLWVLLIFYAVMVIGRSLIVAVDRSGVLRRAFDAPARLALGWAAPVVLAAPLALGFYYLQPGWYAFFGIPTPDQSLIPAAASLIGFGVAFLAGYGLHRQPELVEGLARRWWLNLAVGVGAAVGVLFVLGGPWPNLTPLETGADKALVAGLYALGVFGVSLGLTGAALRFFSGHSPARRYVADASYWIYLIHIPVVMAAQVFVSGLDWPWAVKYPVMLAGVLAILFASYQLLVRHSFIGTWLNGKRSRAARRAKAVVAPAE